jgi:hypothetical protein
LTNTNTNTVANTAGLTASCQGRDPQPQQAQLLRTSNGGATAAAANAESDRLATAAAATVRASKPLSRAGSIVASVASALSRITTGRSVSAGGALKSSSSMYGQPQQPSEETTLLNPLFSPSSQGSIQSSPGQLSSGAAAAGGFGFASSRPDQVLRHRLSQSSPWVGTTRSGEAGSTGLGLGLGTTSSTTADGQIASSSAMIKAGRSGSGVNAAALWMLPPNTGKDALSGGIMQQQEKADLSGTIPAAPGSAAYMAAASAGKHACRHMYRDQSVTAHIKCTYPGQSTTPNRYCQSMYLLDVLHYNGCCVVLQGCGVRKFGLRHAALLYMYVCMVCLLPAM